jgi:hypothetical protein
MRKQRVFTVVRFFSDTKQRFADTVVANDPNEAEDKAVAKQPSLVVCGVFGGAYSPVDTRPHVNL